jgi:hypothetical protein
VWQQFDAKMIAIALFSYTVSLFHNVALSAHCG